MRAIVIMEPGGVDVLALKDVPNPVPDPGQARIRVRALGINRTDLFRRRGMFPEPREGRHDIPGIEFAGEVEGLGAGVDTLQVGDRVMGITRGGAYAEFVNVPSSQMLRIPNDWAFETAAAVPEAFMTAHDAIRRLEISANDWVIVTAIGSGVGTAALQLLKLRGARCIGVSRTEAKLAQAAELGVDVGIFPFPLKFASEVRRVTGGGADAAVELVAGTFFPEILHAMKPRGRVMVVGTTGGQSATVDLSVILENRLRLEGTVHRHQTHSERSRQIDHFAANVMPLFETGHIRPVVDRVFELEEIRDAHRYVEANANFGKVVVRIGD